MIKSTREWAEYILDVLTNLEVKHEFDVDILELLLDEYLAEHLEWDLTEQHKKLLEANATNKEFVEGFVAQYSPNYYNTIQEAITKFLTPYMIVEVTD